MEDHLKRLYKTVDEFKVGKNWKTYVDAFVFGCKIRTLAPRTLNVYAERLGYPVRYLEGKGIDIEDVTKQNIQDYLLSLIGSVSDDAAGGTNTLSKVSLQKFARLRVKLSHCPNTRIAGNEVMPLNNSCAFIETPLRQIRPQ